LTETITLKDDQMFLVSDTAGEIKSGLEGYGLYFEDTRYLSNLELTINGLAPQALNFNADYNIAATFHLSSPYFSQLQQADSSISQAQTAVAHAVSIIRKRQVQGGLVEELKFTNFHPEPLSVEFALKVSADFADIFRCAATHATWKGPLRRWKSAIRGGDWNFARPRLNRKSRPGP